MKPKTYVIVYISVLLFLITIAFLTFPKEYKQKEDKQVISIFYQLNIPQYEFAVGDIKSALEQKDFIVKLKDIETLPNDFKGQKIVITLNNDPKTKGLILKNKALNIPAEIKKQAYVLRSAKTDQLSQWVVGGDYNGAMYGALQLAENINFNGFNSTFNEDEEPHIKNRGIKFNIPLDFYSPTYYYSTDGTANRKAIEHVWDMDFWTTWFDEMARHRYNVLSLWSPHPFTSMLNMEDEYPGIAIQDVTGFDDNSNPLHIKNLSIDEKVKFWQDVMEYGKNRGFDIYFCTWNIFLTTAEGKHGITKSPHNPKTKEYLKKCTKKFLKTYPNLSGLGVTVGERMGGLEDQDKELWAWDTYGSGMMEFAKENPNRDLVFIHRQHDGNLDDILKYFKPLDNLPNVRVDLSFKYSQAHAHTAVDPDYWDKKNMKNALDKTNLKSWLTIRNDDFYFLHWADPNFVRDYINNFPEIDKYVNAFYIGADGWVFTKDFVSKNPFYKDKKALSVQRTWFMQKLWGRISYNPAVSDQLFKNHLQLKYPEVASDLLFEAWSKASRAVKIANEQVTGTWDLDMDWWPEGWTGNCWNYKGNFLTLEETRLATPFSGSNLCSFKETAKNNCNDKVSAHKTIKDIEVLANRTLHILDELNTQEITTNIDLQLNIENIKAMCYLALYNAQKFKGAIYLEQENKKAALEIMGNAYCSWRAYTNIMDKLFIGVKMQRNLDFKSWHDHDKDALKDYLNLGGNEKDLDCTTY